MGKITKKPNKTANKNSIDSKLKPLSPTLRTKKRFIKAKIISKDKFDFKEISEDLLDHILLFLGTIELGKSGVWILRDKFNQKDQEIILKVNTKTKDKLIAILTLLSKIKGKDAKLEVMKVSGTLKGLN